MSTNDSLSWCDRYVSTPFSLDVGEVAHIKQSLKIPPPARSAGLITKYSVELLQQVP